jgi:3-oxoacyl-[acyl-carrier protein] reductase
MIEKMTLQQWSDVIAVHLEPFFGHRLSAGPWSRKQKAASNTPDQSSIYRRMRDGLVLSARSTMPRRRVVFWGMTMTAAKEWSKFGVRTNSVCVGVVETPMTEAIRGEKSRDGILARIPMGRWVQPEEAVKPACFLLPDAASYITG